MTNEDFYEAAIRHWLDGSILEEQGEYDNAVCMQGFAAECALPTRLQGAVEKVSIDRVRELTLEEYQWLQNLIMLLNKKSMLMERTEFLGYLSPENWPVEERRKLPGKSSIEILETLKTLGIVMETADERINIPEIYLHGFGLKRKGGIKRPKLSHPFFV